MLVQMLQQDQNSRLNFLLANYIPISARVFFAILFNSSIPFLRVLGTNWYGQKNIPLFRVTVF